MAMYVYNQSAMTDALNCLNEISSNIESISSTYSGVFSVGELDNFSGASNGLANCTANLTNISGMLSNISNITAQIKNIYDKDLDDDSKIAYDIKEDEWIRKRQEWLMEEYGLDAGTAFDRAEAEYQVHSLGENGVDMLPDGTTYDGIDITDCGYLCGYLVNIDEGDAEAIKMLNATIGTSYVLMKDTYSDFLNSDTDLSYSDFYNEKLSGVLSSINDGTLDLNNYNLSSSDKTYLDSINNYNSDKIDIKDENLKNYYDDVTTGDELKISGKDNLDEYLNNNKEVNKIADEYIKTIEERTGEEANKDKIVYHRKDNTETFMYDGENSVIKEIFEDKITTHLETTGKNPTVSVDENGNTFITIPKVTIDYDKETGKATTVCSTLFYDANGKALGRVDETTILKDVYAACKPTNDEYINMFNIDTHSQNQGSNGISLEKLLATATEATYNHYKGSATSVIDNLNNNGCGYFSFSAALKSLGVNYNALDVAYLGNTTEVVFDAKGNFGTTLIDAFCDKYGFSELSTNNTELQKKLLTEGYAGITTVGGNGQHFVCVTLSGKTDANGNPTYTVVNSFFNSSYDYGALSKTEIVNELTEEELYSSVGSSWSLIGTSDASSIISNYSDVSSYHLFNEELYNSSIEGELSSSTFKAPTQETVAVTTRTVISYDNDSKYIESIATNQIESETYKASDMDSELRQISNKTTGGEYTPM